MGLIITVAVGTLLGWLSAVLTRTARTKSGRKIAAGIFGALLGAFFLGPVVGGGDLLSITIHPETLAISAAGAGALLLLAHLVRRRRRRPELEDDADDGDEEDGSVEFERHVQRY
jgi:uncharacterized membrane protein YeaQ/YmgE (transglycosylase-associated protein family)